MKYIISQEITFNTCDPTLMAASPDVPQKTITRKITKFLQSFSDIKVFA